MSEEWKPILDYPDYEVSNLGQVRRNGKIRKTSDNQHGYNQVILCKNSKAYSRKVHRLVAEAFIPNPENKPQVDHIDRNRTNNVVTNLRWVDNSENGLNTKSRDRELFGIRKVKSGYVVSFTKESENNRTETQKRQEYFGWRKTLEEAKELRASILG